MMAILQYKTHVIVRFIQLRIRISIQKSIVYERHPILSSSLNRNYHNSSKMKRTRDDSSCNQEEDIVKKYIVAHQQDSTLVTKKVKTKKKKKDKKEKKQKQADSAPKDVKVQDLQMSNNLQEKTIKTFNPLKNQQTYQADNKLQKQQKSKKKKNKEKERQISARKENTESVERKSQKDKTDQVEKSQKIQKAQKVDKQSKSNKTKQHNQSQENVRQKNKKQHKKKKEKKKDKKQKSHQKLGQDRKNQKEENKVQKKTLQTKQPQLQPTQKKKKKSKKQKKTKSQPQIFDEEQQEVKQNGLRNPKQKPITGQSSSQKQVKMQFNDGQSEFADKRSVSKMGSQSSQSKKSKSQNKEKKSSQSINVTNRQLAKQCVAKKSNFYLNKQDCIKQGLPVGRGSRKQQQSIIAERKKLKNEKCRINKQRRKAFLQSKQGSAQSQTGLSVAQPSQMSQSDWQQDSVTKYKHSKKGKKDECTLQQSMKIITQFEKDAGDYKSMVKVLGFSLVKIRSHLRTLFQYCLTIISSKVIENGMKISDWQILQKREIIRQLHRIRCTNRLLSQQNAQFREKFIKLMMSYNDPSLKLENNDYNYLYRKIEAFVRGYCTLGTKKKTQVKNEESLEMNRPPLLQGGYILDKNRVKREVKMEVKMEQKQDQVEQKKIDLQKIIYDWTEEEQRTVCKLYMENHSNFDAIIEQLCLKFGKKNRWKDFQILGRKIDHLVKLGLYKIQELTSKPYNREERYKQEQEKAKNNKPKLIDPSKVRSQVNSLDLLTQFIYNNKKVVAKAADSYENGIFPNPALLQRQIYGHVQSFKVKIALVGLLSEKFPTQEEIDKVVKVAQQFMIWAEDLEQKNGVIHVKRSDFIKPKTKGKTTQIRRSDSEDSEDKNHQFDELIFELNGLQKAESQKVDSTSLYSGLQSQEIPQNRLQEQVMKQT